MPNVLAIAAHPDDIEFLMSGTLMLLKNKGYNVHYLNVANGSCGTSELGKQEIIQQRRSEAIAAANFLGAAFHESICDDLAIFYDQATLAKVASIVRDVDPEILLTHSPTDYMEDHTNVCRLAVTAAFARGMRNFPVLPPRDPISGNVTVYHAQPYSHHDPLGRRVEPEFFVDVTSVINKKVAMLELHASQRNWLDVSQGQDSYLKTLQDLDAECGRMSGKFKFAEGWRRHFHLGFCPKNEDPLRQALEANIHVNNNFKTTQTSGLTVGRPDMD